MTFKRILIALDRSPYATSILEQALQQAKPGESSFMLVHTLRLEADIQTGPFLGIGTLADVDTYGTLKRLQQERMQKAIQKTQGWMESFQQQAIAHGIHTEIDCRVGEPGVWICELAQHWNADLIITGRRGYQGLKEVVLGSVSNYVVHHAPCSVLILQGVASLNSDPLDTVTHVGADS